MPFLSVVGLPGPREDTADEDDDVDVDERDESEDGDKESRRRFSLFTTDTASDKQRRPLVLVTSSGPTEFFLLFSSIMI